MFGSKFWEEAAGVAATKWGERLLSPALWFWLGGFAAVGTRWGWGQMAGRLQGMSELGQVALAVGGLLGVAGSAALVEQVQLPVLRWLEGYWPGWLSPLARRARARQVDRMRRDRQAYTALARRYADLTPAEQEEYVRLDADLHLYPDESRLLPTRLGNTLRAAEEYPWRRYGLAMGVVWPRLWLVLPPAAREDITAARGRLDGATRLVIWAALFVVWTWWAWWALPLAAIGVAIAWGQLVRAAGLYGDLLRAAFDLHRFALYRALHWPLPPDPASERAAGRALTGWLWRGAASGAVRYTAQNN